MPYKARPFQAHFALRSWTSVRLRLRLTVLQQLVLKIGVELLHTYHLARLQIDNSMLLLLAQVLCNCRIPEDTE